MESQRESWGDKDLCYHEDDYISGLTEGDSWDLLTV